MGILEESGTLSPYPSNFKFCKNIHSLSCTGILERSQQYKGFWFIIHLWGWWVVLKCVHSQNMGGSIVKMVDEMENIRWVTNFLNVLYLILVHPSIHFFPLKLCENPAKKFMHNHTQKKLKVKPPQDTLMYFSIFLCAYMLTGCFYSTTTRTYKTSWCKFFKYLPELVYWLTWTHTR